jgi:hypothetical protein
MRAASDADADNGPLAFDAAVWAERAGDTPGALALSERAAAAGHAGGRALRDRLSGTPNP